VFLPQSFSLKHTGDRIIPLAREDDAGADRPAKPIMQTVTTIGLDIATSVFQEGNELIRRKLVRIDVSPRMYNAVIASSSPT
jgi:hypothetical protein